MTGRFDYLLGKIAETPFCDLPFRHLEIRDFLSPDDFRELIAEPQVAFEVMPNAEALLEELERQGYVFLHFPGCVSSKREYLDFLSGTAARAWHEATEGFGIVYRLMEIRSRLIEELDGFFRSDALREVLVEKFGIERAVTIDAGLQKYLDGYEISPHPDIRRKALTWMLNINPGVDSHDSEFHTHYLKLKQPWRFIEDFWRDNPEYDRDWLPWDWCQTVKRQRHNNSIVFFSPSDDTLHAVKARYDHLAAQRTQMYGNLWYEKQSLPKVRFEHFDIAGRLGQEAAAPAASSLVERLRRKVAASPVGRLKRRFHRSDPGGYRAVEF